MTKDFSLKSQSQVETIRRDCDIHTVRIECDIPCTGSLNE